MQDSIKAGSGASSHLLSSVQQAVFEHCVETGRYAGAESASQEALRALRSSDDKLKKISVRRQLAVSMQWLGKREAAISILQDCR